MLLHSADAYTQEVVVLQGKGKGDSRFEGLPSQQEWLCDILRPLDNSAQKNKKTIFGVWCKL